MTKQQILINYLEDLFYDYDVIPSTKQDYFFRFAIAIMRFSNNGKLLEASCSFGGGLDDLLLSMFPFSRTFISDVASEWAYEKIRSYRSIYYHEDPDQ